MNEGCVELDLPLPDVVRQGQEGLELSLGQRALLRLGRVLGARPKSSQPAVLALELDPDLLCVEGQVVAEHLVDAQQAIEPVVELLVVLEPIAGLEGRGVGLGVDPGPELALELLLAGSQEDGRQLSGVGRAGLVVDVPAAVEPEAEPERATEL